MKNHHSLRKNRVIRTGIYLPVGLILLQSLLYGFGDPITKDAFEVMPVFSLLTIRYSIAFLVLFLFSWKQIIADLRSSSVRDWIVPSICVALTYIVNNIALDLAAATSVAFLRSLSTVMTPLFSWILLRNRYRWRQIAVQIMVLPGMYLLCVQGGLSGFGMGEICAILSAAFMAASLVFSSGSLQRISPVTLTAVQSGVSALFAAVFAFLKEGGIQNIGETSPKIWGIILYLALACTLAGYLLQNLAVQRISSRMVALLQCTCPVITTFFSWILLGERLSVPGMTGAGMILICVILSIILFDFSENNIQEREEK